MNFDMSNVNKKNTYQIVWTGRTKEDAKYFAKPLGQYYQARYMLPKKFKRRGGKSIAENLAKDWLTPDIWSKLIGADGKSQVLIELHLPKRVAGYYLVKCSRKTDVDECTEIARPAEKKPRKEITKKRRKTKKRRR